MQFMDRIDAIDQRARTVNLSLWALCRRVRLDYSRICRWRAGDNSPTVRTLEKYAEKLEREMDAVEDELRQRLAVGGGGVPSALPAPDPVACRVA